MSVEAVTAVFAMRGLSPHEKLVALRFAERANADGSETYPSAATVAADTGMSVRGVRGVISTLMELGVLIPGGLSSLGTRSYKLDLSACAPDAPCATRTSADRAGVQDAHGEGDAEGECASPHDPVRDAHPNRPGTTPEPSKGAGALEPAKSKAKRRTRIPDPFILNGAMREWAAEKTPTVDVRSETEKFVDYHRGKGDPQLDWIATWRNWMRNAVRFNGNGRAKASVGADTVDAARRFAEEPE